MRDYASESFWLDDLGEEIVPRAAHTGRVAADVAIVGAGYTGLWTALYLLREEPSLRVVVCDAGVAGCGASGRNGGWLMGLAEGVSERLRDPATRDDGQRWQRALFDTVDEVGRVAAQEGIDCDFAKGGMLQVASTPADRARLLASIAERRTQGFGEEDFRWLEPDALARRLHDGARLGALYCPHVAAIHPARLVRGLARAVEARGGQIFERSPVRRVGERRLELATGIIEAPWVVLATEGYTSRLPGRRRKLIPMHSMMIATEPLSADRWAEVGLAGREAFGGAGRIALYGQRTASGRVAFGARGAYYYGSRVRERFAADDPQFARVRAALVQMLPQLEGVAVTHRWGGPLGISRDWCPRLGLFPERGLALAGGYVGEGVGAANLAGRTLADGILEQQTERTELPWVAGEFPDWEPEPLRWLGVSLVRGLGERLDRVEASGRGAPRVAEALWRSFVRR